MEAYLEGHEVFIPSEKEVQQEVGFYYASVGLMEDVLIPEAKAGAALPLRGFPYRGYEP
jgi:hypothetical protein